MQKVHQTLDNIGPFVTRQTDINPTGWITPRWLSWDICGRILWFMVDMTWYSYRNLYFSWGVLNQRSHHWRAPSCFETPLFVFSPSSDLPGRQVISILAEKQEPVIDMFNLLNRFTLDSIGWEADGELRWLKYVTKAPNTLKSFGWWFGTLILFFRILGISSSQLTFIFFRGVETTKQKTYQNIWFWFLNPWIIHRPGRSQWTWGLVDDCSSRSKNLPSHV